MVPIIENLCPQEKYPIKCPFPMKPTRIVIHNTANDAPADREISYMLSRPDEVSFHFAVDDEKIVQGIPTDRNAWHSGDGNGTGNREGIGVEICYSKSGGERFLKSLENAAELTAKLLIDLGLNLNAVTKHQDYSGKRCPHRILDEYGWDNFLNLVNRYFTDIATSPDSPPIPAPKVIYAAHLNGGNWLSDITDYNEQNYDGFAGIIGRSMDGIRAKLTRGSIVYRVHTQGGNYLNWVKDLDIAEKGYAGLYGKNIDGVQMYLENIPDYAIEYRVSLVNQGYLPWVRDYKDNSPDGYAGIYGKPIDRIQIRIIKK